MTQTILLDTTIIITGATGGIGLAAAEELARRGAKVLIVGHRPEHDREVVARLTRETGNDRVGYYAADLAVQAEVRDLARRIRAEQPRLDVLINNVGGFFMRREVTPDGFERTWALNHLNTFLLTWCLRDLLQAGAPARVINVSSDAHRGGRMHWDDLQGERRYSGWAAYSQSKVAMNLMTFALARRWEGTAVAVHAMHPGFVDTGLYRHLPEIIRPLFKPMMKLIAKSPAEGAEPLVRLAIAPEVAGDTGGYWTHAGRVRASKACYDRQAQSRLWDLTMQMVGASE